MEFTKQQRHEIYKKALVYHLNDTSPYSMCFSILNVVDCDVFKNNTPDGILEMMS